MKKWRSKPFPVYDDIQFLVEGTIATGAGAFHAGVLPSVHSQSPLQTQSSATSQSQDASSTVITWSQTQNSVSQPLEWSQTQNLDDFHQIADDYVQTHDTPGMYNPLPRTSRNVTSVLGVVRKFIFSCQH